MDDKTNMEELVRAIVSQVLSGVGEPLEGIRKDKDPASGVAVVKRVSGIKMDPFPFDIGPAGKGVFLKDIFTLGESPRLGIGVMEMTKTSFPWTLRYDEVDYILEGALEIKVNGNVVTGNAGDVLYIPKNSSIEFSAPYYAKFVYVTYPADWSNQ
ncbi:MAG: cupin domain-containing protein [Synergistaceae bacterium]|jgi:ethanolamine utilization protein EutQ|nr:cupin domain-containing protein [Synergistaceae bacterium]